MRVEEVMNRFFVAVRPTATLQEAAAKMRDEGVGIVCVCDDSHHPNGVLTDRDIAIRACADGLPGATTQVQMVMTHEVLTCRPSDEMSVVEEHMKQESTGRVLVVDDEGVLVGVITLAEIWHYESPLAAGAVSRRITSREFRVASKGGESLAIWPAPHDRAG